MSKSELVTAVGNESLTMGANGMYPLDQRTAWSITGPEAATSMTIATTTTTDQT
jgi:hypothetical protein